MLLQFTSLTPARRAVALWKALRARTLYLKQTYSYTSITGLHKIPKSFNLYS
jgi:hypothetical protein